MILAIDPGKTCGLVAIKQDGSLYLRMEADPYRTCSAASDIIARVRPLIVVCERYTIVPKVMSQQTDALETIGALRYICARAGVEFVLQSRSERTRVNNETLQLLGLWAPRTLSPGGHVNEATRHGVAYIVRAQPHHPIAKKLLGRVAAEANSSNGVASDGLRGAS